MNNTSRRRGGILLASIAAVSVLAVACGGGDSGSGSKGGTDSSAPAGKPVKGGEVTYGLEAENSGGWCLPEGQLAISGIQVARTIYDTLTVPNETGQYVPFLAESVTPNADNTVWTVKLRDGVKFHDGTALNAQVVKNNLDAYRGAYPARKPLLFKFVFDNIKSVDVVDGNTLTITTNTPWPALPAFLYGSGRIGIMAQAQLDDPSTCDSKLIGTGPFKLDEWVQNDHLTASRNPDYWQKDASGTQVPYLDKITYKPVVEEDTRVNALLSGQLNAMHTNDATAMGTLADEQKSGNVDVTASGKFAEVSYIMFNSSKPPFDSQTARSAIAYALDRTEMRKVRFQDRMEMASGPFATGEIGYLADTGFPDYDPAKAKQLAAQYQSETGQPLTFTLTEAQGAENAQTAQFIQAQMAKVGIKVDIKQMEQASQINTALGNDWQALYWRNHPGGNPDSQYVWWHSGSPVNFGKFKDAEIDSLLEKGRADPDPAARQKIYEQLNQEFAKKLYNVWTNWSNWTIGTAPDVKGVIGPNLPDGSKPFPGLAVGHPVTGIWIQK